MLSFSDGLRHEAPCERYDVVHFQLAICVLRLTSQHDIDGFASRADCQDSFALFLELETRRKRGPLILDLPRDTGYKWQE